MDVVHKCLPQGIKSRKKHIFSTIYLIRFAKYIVPLDCLNYFHHHIKLWITIIQTLSQFLIQLEFLLNAFRDPSQNIHVLQTLAVTHRYSRFVLATCKHNRDTTRIIKYHLYTYLILKAENVPIFYSIVSSHWVFWLIFPW